jgi:hypothetical protein
MQSPQSQRPTIKLSWIAQLKSVKKIDIKSKKACILPQKPTSSRPTISRI